MKYIAFVYKNTTTHTTAEEWQAFFDQARASGLFSGGGGFGVNYRLGNPQIDDLTEKVSGFLLFDGDDLAAVAELLESHPVVVKGGSIALCEMPKTIAA